MRRGVRLGVDVGSVRVGVARSDPDGTLAVPVATLDRPRGDRGPRADLTGLADLVTEYDPLELVLGLPLGLAGQEGAAAAAVRTYARDLAGALAARGLATPIRLVDERLSTAQAAKGLRSSGRDTRRSRAVIDQAAAVVILQHALESERTAGRPPGELVPGHTHDEDRG